MTKERATSSEEDTSDKVQLQQLINETPVMLTRCSRDLRYVFVSRAYANMLGRSPQDEVDFSSRQLVGRHDNFEYSARRWAITRQYRGACGSGSRCA